MTTQEKQMYEAGGYRERYAMDHGHRTGKYVNGEYCVQYHLTWEQIATEQHITQHADVGWRKIKRFKRVSHHTL